MVRPVLSVVLFALYERKYEPQKEDEMPLRKVTFRLPPQTAGLILFGGSFRPTGAKRTYKRGKVQCCRRLKSLLHKSFPSRGMIKTQKDIQKGRGR
jgi:hypothetical protein